jgi:hypothetical protein
VDSTTPKNRFGLRQCIFSLELYRQIPAKDFNCINLQQKRARQIPLVTRLE